MLATQFSNRIDCSLDTYWEHALTEDYNHGLYAEFLKYPHYKLVHTEDTGDQVHRHIQYAPPPAPGWLRKLAGPFRAALLTEVHVFDKATRSATIEYIPNKFPSLMNAHAKISCAPVGDASIERVIACEMSLEIPLIGGSAERSLAGFLEDQAVQHARFAEAYFARVTTTP